MKNKLTTALIICAFASCALPVTAALAQDTKKVTSKSKKSSKKTPATVAAAVVEPTEGQKDIATRVLTGSIPCELGDRVALEPNPKQPAGFVLSFKGKHYPVMPVESRTGAIRLEDPKDGIVWIQLANKSALFNSKQGQRWADDCKHPTQASFVMPTGGPGIFDAAASAPASTPASAPATK